MARVFRVAQVLAPLSLVTAPSWSQTAASSPSSYSLAWVRAEGAEQCPASRALVAGVEQRLGRRVFDATAARSFEVEVTRVGEQYRSDVYLRDEGGRTLGHRALQSDERDCGALANATALAIALLIDPSAAEHEPPRGVAAFEALPPAAAPPAPPVAVPAPPQPVPAPKIPAVEADRAPCVPPQRPALLASLRGEVALGLVPETSAGVALAFRVRHRSRWGLELGGAYTLPQNAARGRGSLDLGLTRADALVTFDVGGGPVVRGVVGAGASLGAFHVAVREPAPVTAPGDYWFGAARLLASLQVSVTRDVFVEAGASGWAPLLRQQFLVRGQTEPVFRQPPFSGAIFGGVGVQFQ